MSSGRALEVPFYFICTSTSVHFFCPFSPLSVAFVDVQNKGPLTTDLGSMQCVSSVSAAYTAGTLHMLQWSCSVHSMAV